MNKNLKKVISSVAALSMVASSVAAFAAQFPDVESGVYYEQAVQELSSLGVISGYDDGTFGPDKLVTRAEITKMIVDALKEGSSASASKNTQKFNDVTAGESGHWAAGYINQGVTDGWIAGMGDGTFAPDANVTYVQAQKMLVAAVGYDTYATAKGGWPAGYKLYANQLEVTSGVQDVTSDDQELTRAQVAKMIDNAMDAPLCVVTNWETQWNGSQTPVLDIKDGQGKEYQTLFTDKHKAYKVYGRVTATSKSGTGLEADQVSFNVEKADNFDDEYIKATDDPTEIDAYIGDSKADQYLTVYAQALIQINDDDEYTILSIAPAAANKSVTVLAEDIDDSKTSLADNVMYFFPAGQTRGSVKYKLAENVTWYVNGVKQDGSFDDKAYANYIYYEDANGKGVTYDSNAITLQKTTKNGTTSTDSNYDTIMITSYTTAVVDEVLDKTNQTQINFKEKADGIKANMKLEKDDDTKTYSFTFNGEAIEPTDLQTNDVLSISYDENAGFENSDFYDVIVSRDVKESVKCTSGLNKDNEVTLGGTKYKIAHGMSSVSVDTSTTYTIYLDAFGRIAYADEDASTKKIAVLKSLYQKNNGDYVADLITKEGETITDVKVDDEDGAEYMKQLAPTETTSPSGEKVNVPKSERYPKQVIEYKISSSNKLTIENNGKVLDFEGGDDQEYKASSNKIGSIRISDATAIIDMSDIDNKDTFKVISASDLKDGVLYNAYGYDKSSTDSTYRFVIITDGMGGVDSTTQLSIFLEAGSDVDDNDDEVDTMTVVNNGEQTTVTLDEDCEFANLTSLDSLAEGDLVLYATNGGLVTEIHKVFAGNALENATDYEDFRNDAFKNYKTMLDKDIPDLTDGDEDEVDVTFGVLVKNGSTTQFATEIKNDAEIGYYVDLEADSTLDLGTSDAKVYTYNFDNSPKYFGRIGLDDGIMATSLVTAARYDVDEAGKFVSDRGGSIFSLSDEGVIGNVTFAVVRTFDTDVAQEIYQIVAE